MSNTPENPVEKPVQRFSHEVEDALLGAGWEPGRLVPDEQMEQWLLLECETAPGYRLQIRMFPAAWRILREFGGLDVERIGPGRGRRLIFDPIQGLGRTLLYNWPFSEWEADGSLYPIGVLLDGTSDDSPLVVDGKGQIILYEFDKFLGSSIEEALQSIVDSRYDRLWDVGREKTREAAEVFPLMRGRLGLN